VNASGTSRVLWQYLVCLCLAFGIELSPLRASAAAIHVLGAVIGEAALTATMVAGVPVPRRREIDETRSGVSVSHRAEVHFNYDNEGKPHEAHTSCGTAVGRYERAPRREPPLVGARAAGAIYDAPASSIAAEGGTVELFHGTTQAGAKSIMSEGLQPVSRNTAPFPSGSFFTHAGEGGQVGAFQWAASRATGLPGGAPTVLRGTMPQAVFDSLSSQGLIRTGPTWAKSGRMPGPGGAPQSSFRSCRDVMALPGD